MTSDRRSHLVRSAWQAEMVSEGGEIHAVEDCRSTCMFATSSKFFFCGRYGKRFHPVRKLQQQNIDRGWRLTTILQCRKAHNVTNTKCFLKLTSSVDPYFVVLNDFSRSRSRQLQRLGLGLGLKGLVHITAKYCYILLSSSILRLNVILFVHTN